MKRLPIVDCYPVGNLLYKQEVGYIERECAMDRVNNIRKDMIITIEIDDIGSEGEGIGHIDGYALFVKDTVMGDVAEVKVIKTKKSYGYGRLIRIISPSPKRMEPICPIAKQCGGCQIQHINYKDQLNYKENKVMNCLTRIGGFQEEHIKEKREPIIGMDNPYYYRNKAQFPIGRDAAGNVVIGFYAKRTHSIIDTTHCYIQAEVNEDILKKVKEWITRHNISTYDEVTHKGLIRHILTRVGFTTGEIMVCLIINGTSLPHKEELIESLTQIENIKSITINKNIKKTNVILGEELETIWGSSYISDYIGNIKYHISPLSFYQVNPVQTKVLYETALEYADLHGKEVVWDLYCGIGTISLFLAQKAKSVYGVEIIPQAIEDARENARINNIDNVEFYVGEAEEVLPRIYKEEKIYADVIVVDPPRKGCDESLLNTIVDMKPEKVVYVSCDPATLSRDIRYLCDRGYELRRIKVVDQFSHTVHVETVVLLSQQKPSDRIEVDLDMDEMDVTSAETKATYVDIKDYVLKEHGLKVSNLYISQVKRKCGLEVGENYNLAKSEDAKQPNCPEDKEKAIEDALKHFGMIS